MKLTFRDATQADLPIIIDMLADDELGAQREDISKPLNQAYLLAFGHIASDPNNELLVVEAENKIAGTLQLTFIPYLTHIGPWRCLIEGRIAAAMYVLRTCTAISFLRFVNRYPHYT